MKFTKKQRLNIQKGQKLLLILLFLFNAIMPLMFTWIVEISTDMKENIVLTNGFIEVNPLKIYHLSLYGMSFVTIMTSLFAIYNQKNSPNINKREKGEIRK